MKVLELFNGVGDENGITLDMVSAFLNANKDEPITFRIASLGGDLNTALTIASLIKLHQKPTVAEIVGLTASAGTIIAMACDTVDISDTALFLIHNGWQEVAGNQYELQAAAIQLEKTDAIMRKIYMDATGLEAEKIDDLMKKSDWLTPTEALNYGFVNNIVSLNAKVAASVALAHSKLNINSELLTKLNNKMDLFGKKKPVVNVLALKDGSQLICSGKELAKGAEVLPVNAATLEDGTFELSDGRIITVAGGMITDIQEAKEMEASASTDEIVAAVSEVVEASINAAIEGIEAKFNAQIEALKKGVSAHVPPKGVEKNDPKKVANVHAKVGEVAAKIRESIVNARNK